VPPAPRNPKVMGDLQSGLSDDIPEPIEHPRQKAPIRLPRNPNGSGRWR